MQILLFVVSGIALLGLIIYPNYKRMNLQKATVGMMYAIITKPGVRLGGLYPADELTIDIPLNILKSGTHVKGKEKGTNSYLLNPDAIEPIQYPVYSGDSNRSWLARWFNPTVTIRSILLIEGYTIPIIPAAVDSITGQHIIPEGTASSYVNAFKDQANAAALSRKGREYAEGEKATGGIKKQQVSYLLIGVALAVLFSIAGAGLGYFILTEVTNISTGFGL